MYVNFDLMSRWSICILISCIYPAAVATDF